MHRRKDVLVCHGGAERPDGCYHASHGGPDGCEAADVLGSEACRGGYFRNGGFVGLLSSSSLVYLVAKDQANANV